MRAEKLPYPIEFFKWDARTWVIAPVLAVTIYLVVIPLVFLLWTSFRTGQIGMPAEQVEREQIDRTLDAARARISPEAYEKAWREGRTVPLERVRGVRNNLQALLAGQSRQGVAIPLQPKLVAPAYDEQRRGHDGRKHITREVGSTAPRDDCPHGVTQPRSGNERRRRSGARAEEAEVEITGEFVCHAPNRRAGDTSSQHLHVKPQMTVRGILQLFLPAE